MTFTPEVYEQIREGARRSAAVIVPLAFDLFAPKTVLDVGCGEGMFAEAFAALGCLVDAIDESQKDTRVVRDSSWVGEGAVSFRHADLTGDAWATPAVESDLAVCLEVAEHLPAGVAGPFVATLCALAPVVLFSAAIPGQGGHGHLNEQWPAYWVERFERHGFEVSGELRWRIWGHSYVEPWYQQNLLVAVHRERAVLSELSINRGIDELFGEQAFDDPIPVVHPTTFTYWVEIAKRRANS